MPAGSRVDRLDPVAIGGKKPHNLQEGYHIMAQTTIKTRNAIAECLDLGEYGEFFADYDSGYICDVISEIADSNVHIYYHDIREWAVDNYEWVEEAVNEGLVDTRDFDYHKAIQCGQYLYIQEDIYRHLEDCVRLAVLTGIDADEITEEQLDAILSIEFGTGDRIDDLIDEAKRIINPDEDEDDEC